MFHTQVHLAMQAKVLEDAMKALNGKFGTNTVMKLGQQQMFQV